MKCASHVDLDAVGVCNSCQKGLCQTCSSIFHPPECADCVAAHNKQVSFKFVRNLVTMGALFAATLWFAWQVLPFGKAVLVSLAVAFVPWGWEFLSRFFNAENPYQDLVTRMLSISIHLAGSLVVGLFVGPYQVYRTVRELQSIRETEKLLATLRS